MGQYTLIHSFGRVKVVFNVPLILPMDVYGSQDEIPMHCFKLLIICKPKINFVLNSGTSSG